MSLPPSSAGGSKDTSICPETSVGPAATFSGAPGTVSGVNVAEFEAGPEPAALNAETTTVYSWPLTSGTDGSPDVAVIVPVSSEVPVVARVRNVAPPSVE